MKISILTALLLLAAFLNAQTLPFDFEADIITTDFEDFDGGTATVIPNPQIGGINTSAAVGQIVRNGGTIWSGSKILLEANLDLTTDGAFSMKVFTTNPIGTIFKFKLEGPGTPVEIDIPTTVTGEWEEITWDFTGLPGVFNYVVFMFDYGNVGDGSQNSTFLFDDVTQGPDVEILGCTYSGACNYNSGAQVDDGSCVYTCFGCLDELALNYNSEATVEDNSCVFDPENFCGGDFNGDGFVNVSDLGGFLGAFGDVCE